MKLKEYIKEVEQDMQKSDGRACPLEFFEDPELNQRIADLDLEIVAEREEYKTWDWLHDGPEARRPYFEMCGPKIEKEEAMKMAADYQWATTDHNTMGLMACYNTPCHFPNNYGVFRLNGDIGLNGISWKWNLNFEVLGALLEMICDYPEFEFAVLFTNWDETPGANWKIGIYGSREIVREQEKDVYVGFWYEPHKKLLRILGPRSALKAVRNYQKQYTPQRRALFEPEQSEMYYAADRKAQKDLTEFAIYDALHRKRKQNKENS